MKDRRFQFTYGNVATFADRLRLGGYDCPVTGRYHLALVAGDPADESLEQAPVTIDLPKKDRAAYERAAAAFNQILDDHEAVEARKLARRRARGRSDHAASATSLSH